MDDNDILEMLRQRVETNGLRETARQIGMEPSTLYRYLSGERSFPGNNQMKKILDYLGIEKIYRKKKK